MGRILICICVLTLWIGCSTKKRLTTADKLVSRSEAELLKALSSHNLDATWYAVKGKARVEGEGQSFTGTIYLRLKRDSIIWGMAKKLSIEGGRFLCTPDHATLINRIDGTYMERHTDRLLHSLNASLSFRDVQEVLMGNIILPQQIDSIRTQGSMYSLYFTDQGIGIRYDIHSRSQQLKRAIYTTNDQEISTEYSNYLRVNNGTLHPHDRSISFSRDGNKHMKLDLSFRNVEVNVAKRTPFSIPRRYEKVGW